MGKENKRLEFSTSTRREMLDNEFKTSSCMFINCNEKLKRTGPSTFTGDFCHIIAASYGGPRYSDEWSSDFIQSKQNCLLLCKKCAHMIDNMKNENNELQYDADFLFNIKTGYLKKIKHYNSIFSYSELFKDLKKLLDFINCKVLGKSQQNSELKTPVEIAKKIEINQLLPIYKNAIDETVKIFQDISFLITSYDDNVNNRIKEIRKYYIDISDKNGNDIFDLIIKFIIQENGYFYIAGLHFTSYLFIRCDLLKTQDSEVLKLLC